MSTAARFAGHFTVYVTSRKPGLAAGGTMADIAADAAPKPALRSETRQVTTPDAHDPASCS